jgi:hypothetical protein
MGKLSMNDWPPFKRKKKPVVDSCKPGDPDCDTSSGDSSKKHKTEQRIPTGGNHMNMNNLGGNPGDVRMQKSNTTKIVTPDGEADFTVGQNQRGRAGEDAVAKQKAKIARRKAMLDTLTGKKRKKADQTNMMP